ncbi:MAG: mersacidin/lichenicidin family type 2 lantibiotic [Chloroflexi bacterium]|nr:mersacidin/lichenicidin family type 2 lantibiotic [Chloroflexota bacterium]OJV89927.1 MAG: hypothetical protein BGO39_34335 [Chloroflexi bacterium 54-19]
MTNRENKIDIVRAWKDEEYRSSLTPDQLAQLPANPAGDAEAEADEITRQELDEVSGGWIRPRITIGCPQPWPIPPQDLK